MRLTRRRGERGASAVELAMLAPAFLFLVFFTIQASLYFYGRNVAIQSAREGVSQLRLAQDEATYRDIRPEVEENVRRFAVQVGREALIDPQVVTGYDDVDGRVEVEVTGKVITLVPFLTLRTSQRAEGPVERFEGWQP